MLEKRIALPADPQSGPRARRALRQVLTEAGLGPESDDEAVLELGETAILLTSELCDNAVLHAGTGFELVVTVTDLDVTITVTDHGIAPLEHYLNSSQARSGRAATHGRGLMLVDRAASAWGTKHDVHGHHTWFRLDREQGGAAAGDQAEALHVDSAASLTATPPGPQAVRELLHLPSDLRAELTLGEELTELLRRLLEITGLAAAGIEIDYDDGRGTQTLAAVGTPPPAGTRDTQPTTSQLTLPLRAPLRGILTLCPTSPTTGDVATQELLLLGAHRIALSIEADWLRGIDHSHRAWMTYLAEASELLGQARDVDLAAALIPQIVVPRLGRWCALYRNNDPAGGLELAALNHQDEDEVEPLRTALAHNGVAALIGDLVPATGNGSGPTQLTAGDLAMVTVPLVARGQVLGMLTVAGQGRAPTPDETMVLADLARRAAQAIDNTQHLAEHRSTSHALQRALLPRAVPTPTGIEFAAEYLPASSAAAVGGDFYDVLELQPDTRWLTFIGDVCGKGPQAAARTGLVRDMLRVLCRDGRTTERTILDTVNQVLLEARDPYQFCTLATAVITRSVPGQPPGLDVALVLAGHEPLILRRADGSAELVGTAGSALGLLPAVQHSVSHLHLGPGDCLIAYTDGLVEQRRRHGDGRREQFGHARLLASLTPTAGLSASQLVSHLRTTLVDFSPEPQHDDIAILVIRAGSTDADDRPVQTDHSERSPATWPEARSA